MSNTEPASSSKRPTHRVYAVSKGKGDKKYWREIGAAWSHADAKGFSVKLELLPVNGGEIVLRSADDAQSADTFEAQAKEAA